MSAPTEKPASSRKPWPMTWVLLAVLSFMVVHTLVNVVYRKPEPAHEPWVEAQKRRPKFVNATMGDWRRHAASVQAVASAARLEASAGDASVHRVELEEPLILVLPFDLVGLIMNEPKPAPPPGAIRAPSAARAAEPLRFELGYASSEKPPSLGEPLVYTNTKSHELYLIVQDHRALAPDTKPLAAAERVSLELPPDTFTPGDWRAYVFTEDAAFTWTFRVSE